MSDPTFFRPREASQRPGASPSSTKRFGTCVARWLAAMVLAAAAPLVGAQSLVIGLPSGPASMDPHYSNSGSHAEAMKHIFDTLVWATDDLRVEPRLAESWSLIDDTTWRFKLRKNVKFHDGSDFTAADVKFSVERIPVVSGPTPTTAMIRRVKEVKIVDDHTVDFITNGPAATLPNDLNRLFIVSHNAAKDYSTQETANAGFNSGKAAIGTGPYKLVSWMPKNQLVLERFDGYWGGKQPWQKVTLKEIPNDAARIAQLKAGQVDLIARVSGTDVAALKRDPKLSVVTADTIYVFHMEFDRRDKTPKVWSKDGKPLERNPFLDPRVREAFDLAVDRPALIEAAMEGLGAPANQFVPPFVFGFNKSLPPRKFDLARARQLMAEAGYPDGFKVQFSFTSDRLPGDRQVGTTVAQMLARIGVDAEANAQPITVFFPARARGDYSLSMMGIGAPTGDAQVTMTSFLHTADTARKAGGFNWMHYSNPEFDKMLVEAGRVMDTEKRRAMVGQALAVVAKDRPDVPLATIQSAWAMRKSKISFKPRNDEDTLAMNAKPVK
jgi:peptide/nickel transport system substrate-binding protein